MEPRYHGLSPERATDDGLEESTQFQGQLHCQNGIKWRHLAVWDWKANLTAIQN